MFRRLFPVLLLLVARTAFADVSSAPQSLGPYHTDTIEFPDLRDERRHGRLVPMKIHIPKPPTGSGGSAVWPIVVVSHGGGGGWDANYAQAKHLASYGYFVICLEHIGSNTRRMKKGFRLMRNLKEMTRDSDEVLNRPRDMSFAIDTATRWTEPGGRFAGRLDMERIGVLGHSFGAYTVLAVCGARPALDWLVPAVAPGSGLGPDLSDYRVKACVALSPQGPGEPFFLKESYQSISRPVMGITGSKDVQQDLPPENRKLFFEFLPPGDKVFLWLTNADHVAFSDSTGAGLRMFRSASRQEVQPISRAATLLFFEGYLRGNRQALGELSVEKLRPLMGKIITEIAVQSK